MNHLLFQTQFPLKSDRLKGAADPVATSTKEAGNLRKTTKAMKPSKKAIRDTAKSICLNINEQFKNLYSINLADALTKVPETGLTHAKTKVQKQKERREIARRRAVVLKSSGQKLTVTPCLERGSHLNREIYKENIFILSPIKRLKFGQRRGKHSRRQAFAR